MTDIETKIQEAVEGAVTSRESHLVADAYAVVIDTHEVSRASKRIYASIARDGEMARMREAVRIALEIADTLYQRADAKPDAPAPMGDAARSDAAFGRELRVYAPAPADATEEAIGTGGTYDATDHAICIVARAMGRTPRGVEFDTHLDPDGTDARLVREIAAALRRRSEPRIGTGKIPETVIHDDANGLIARAERKHNGDVLLSYDYTERTRGRATLIPADAFRALVALMARDGTDTQTARDDGQGGT